MWSLIKLEICDNVPNGPRGYILHKRKRFQTDIVNIFRRKTPGKIAITTELKIMQFLSEFIIYILA